MNSQLVLKVPIPIVEEIISFSSFKEKLTFGFTCKRFYFYIIHKYFNTFTTTLCGTILGYENGDFLTARFNGPRFGILDSTSNILFVSDSWNHGIRKIDLSTNRVGTLCGTSRWSGWKDGIGDESQFYCPTGLALSERENILYASDAGNHVIRSVSLIDGRVETIYGKERSFGKRDGIGKDTMFYHPEGLVLDSILNHLYVADSHNHSIRRILLNERRVETLCGNEKDGYVDGSFEEVMFNNLFDISLNSLIGELYVSDKNNHIIRTISLKNREVRTLCGTPRVKGYINGICNRAKFDEPRGLRLDIKSHCLYVCDSNNHVVRKVSLLKEVRVDTLCGIGRGRGKGNKDGFFPTFNSPMGIVIDPQSQSLYVVDCHKVRKIIDRNRAF